MTAAELLGRYNITMQQASDWVQAHVDHPALIFNTARDYGINSSMLAEIVSPWVPGVNAGLVEDFFDSHGLDGSALSPGSGGDSGTGEILPEELAALASLVMLNNNSGLLSTESLRAGVLGELPVDAYYYQLFDPAGYEGAGDGTFTADELGIPGLSNLAATTESLESLYYGTLITAFKAIDVDEIMQIQNFVQANAGALESGSPAVLDQYIGLMVSVFQDPAATPLFPDNELASTIVMATAAAAELMGGGDPLALFDGLFTGFLPA